MTERTAPGRRSAVQRHVDPVMALAVVLPVVVALCLALIGAEEQAPRGPQRPETSDLTVAALACPGAVGPGAAPVLATRVPQVPGGDVAVRTGPVLDRPTGEATMGEPSTVPVEPGRSRVAARRSGVVLLDGRGAAAPGLAAGRAERLAVPECRGPGYDEWLVGLGASARYATTLELVNPDGGDAVVDVELFDVNGPIVEPALRGLTVAPRGVRRVDLAEVAPRRAATAAHFTVTRGRVIATARNTWDPLGSGRVTTDFLPADAAPSTGGLLLGVPRASSGARLFVVNPGDDEVRVTPQLVTRQSVFTPTDAPELTVPAHSLRILPLEALLASEAARGTIGVRVRSTGPVASSLRLLVDDDLVLLAPTPELAAPAAVVVPTGEKELLLGGATSAGTVRVVARDAKGRQVGDERVELTEGTAARVRLPNRAVSVVVTADNTTVRAVVTMPARGRQPGLATLRVRPAEVRARIPAVAPR